MKKITLATTVLLALGLFSVKATASDEILANTMDPSEYTLQHASQDMEKIHERLIASTQTLQDVAQSFEVLIERLEDKKAAHVAKLKGE